MGIETLFGIAVGLSMDAFAVSVCKGLSVKKLNFRHALKCGAYFGFFQALMPLLGWLLGIRFQVFIEQADHWVAFLLLLVIGSKMIYESCTETEALDSDFTPRAMLPMAVATSIDALAVGITFAFLKVEIGPAATMIGLTTFILCVCGTWVGAYFGAKWRSWAEFIGGGALILIGLNILLEHLGLLPL